MARKGILVSNPDVRNMSPAQWAFEYYALHKKESDLAEALATNVKHLIVNILGLNALRPVNENGVPKKPHELTEEEQEQFLPLVAWVGHPELLKKVGEQLQVEQAITQAAEDQSYEEMVAAIDAAGGDMEPILGAIDPEILNRLSSGKKYPSDNKESASDIDLVEDV
jgi:hypothetical protein